MFLGSLVEESLEQLQVEKLELVKALTMITNSIINPIILIIPTSLDTIYNSHLILFQQSLVPEVLVLVQVGRQQLLLFLALFEELAEELVCRYKLVFPQLQEVGVEVDNYKLVVEACIQFVVVVGKFVVEVDKVGVEADKSVVEVDMWSNWSQTLI